MAKNLFKGTPIYEYALRVSKLKGKHRRIFDEVMENKRITDLIVYLNTEDQLGNDGIDSEGQIIGTYSYATEFITDGRKKAGDPYDLNDTGEFWRSFRVIVKGGKITITANPNKVDENIYEKFGNFQIEGLTEKNKEAVRKFCLEYFQDWYRKNVIK